MANLLLLLQGLAKHLFGDMLCRWADTYFPFTEPYAEAESAAAAAAASAAAAAAVALGFAEAPVW
jgi:phenylalanyl-tRNA synthetase alpha subunit